MNKYIKHELTQMPRYEKEGWSKLTWNFKGKERSELVKYPKNYISKLWNSGIEVVHEHKVWRKDNE
jgi:hypothetical protein